MRPIQVLLALAIISVGLFYYGRLRSRLLDRLLFLLLVGSGIIMTLLPDLTRVVAHWLGVGRGVDLVMYSGLVGLGFLWLALYSRQRELEQKLTQLSRIIAVAQASKPLATPNEGGDSTGRDDKAPADLK